VVAWAVMLPLLRPPKNPAFDATRIRV
jgi:hypothetical protein